MPLFTHYIALDWSASQTPKRGKDSIWYAEARAQGVSVPINMPTRAAAVEALRARMTRAVAADERLLVGCDFAFGYPAGLAGALTGRGHWQSVWAYLATAVVDGADNHNNRYGVAAAMNRALALGPGGAADGPFWGHPHQHSYTDLGPKKPTDLPPSFPLWRQVERRATGAKSVYQLAYNGAVGSQTILGIAALERLRRDPALGPHIAVWPFETNFAGDLSKAVTLAEIYPSSHTVDRSAHDILDAAQVMAVSRDLAYWDTTGALDDKLSAFGLSNSARTDVLREEGWIVGV